MTHKIPALLQDCQMTTFESGIEGGFIPQEQDAQLFSDIDKECQRLSALASDKPAVEVLLYYDVSESEGWTFIQYSPRSLCTSPAALPGQSLAQEHSTYTVT